MKIPLENTSSANIRIVLSESFSKGLIKKDTTKLVIARIGVGFNFEACLFKF